eukprot:4740056-Lingulodinium_polyedra.AAC.1
MASASSEPSDHPAIQCIQHLAKGSTCLTKQGTNEVNIACEAAKEVLMSRFKEVIAKAAHRPLLSSKSSDGTPLHVVKRGVYKMPSGKEVRVSGGESAEYMVKLQFLRYIETGGQHETA